ncbi:YczE/YyaS/YitT family protein [Cytobacillus kochii]|uniref:YczE/YyaS/YitT family protein n=1 Tax=Cytobacillus kochii TaxID=859143 RepID=UPI00402AD3A4
MAKRLVLYVLGLFFLSLGVSFSIQADLGVSPVSSLPYALSLSTGMKIGMMTVVANILFIIVGSILTKSFIVKEVVGQLIISFLFGGFMDLTLLLVQIFPSPQTIGMKIIFLLISLFVVAVGLLGYFNAKLPLMPYDALTYSISARFKMVFSKAKITSDLLNVCVAGAVCLIFVHSLGAIGVGTVIAAYFIGKILGWMTKLYEVPLKEWLWAKPQEELSKIN